jgi:hypothetical protein
VTCLRRGSAALAARHEATIGRLAAHLAALRHLSIAVTAQLAQGRSPVVQAALVKDLGTAFEQEIPHVLADLAAGDAELELEHELLTATAYLVQMAPTFSIRGGTRDILRGMIARGLGLR